MKDAITASHRQFP